MKHATTKLMFLFPAIAGPVVVLILDLFSRLATPAELIGALTRMQVLIAFALVTLVGVVSVRAFFVRISRNAHDRPVRAFRLIKVAPAVIVVWSTVQTLAFSTALHAGSPFVTDRVGMWMVGIYAASVGLFFGVLFFVGSVPEWEAKLPLEPVLQGRARMQSITGRFIVSITLTVLSFLFGASGVIIHPLYAGMDLAFAMQRLAMLAVPFLILTFFLVHLMARAITLPLTTSTPTLNRLAEGDLTLRIAISGVDELSLALARMNRFIDHVETSIATAHTGAQAGVQSADSLETESAAQKESTDHVSAGVGRLAERAEELTSHLESTASATEEITRTLESLRNQLGRQNNSVEETVASSEELAASSSNVLELSKKRRQAAEELGKTTEDSRRQTNTAVENMESIASRVDELQNLNKVIAGLAAQTNMLAMNAAIEAAHAGEAGRGFSVVAEEIRNLAESASRNAKQSSDFLKNVVEEIEKTNETIQGVQSSFAKVDEESRSVVESLSEIVSASQEMSETSRGIRRQMEQLQQINREVVEGANQISEGVSDINKADQQSKSVAEEVRDKSAEITESMNKLVRSADQIAEIAGSLHTGAGNVLEELRRFTVNTRREAG